MSNPPERIWIEDEFGEGDDDQWTYGTWDVRNYRGYVVEYVRADIVQALTADRDRLREASGDVIRETFASYRQAEEAYAAHLKAEADNARLREALETCLATMERADFAEGWCCCGDDMLKHSSPMDCGHTPVDAGEYYASLALEKARATLTGKADT